MSRVRDLPGDHRGSASVLAVVLLGVLAATAVLVAAVGGVVVDQRRVAAAADLGALAAASALQQGEDPCAAARSVAGRNGARLAGCAVQGQVVGVRVTRQARLLLGHRIQVSSQARAGPVDDPVADPEARPVAGQVAGRARLIGGGAR